MQQYLPFTVLKQYILFQRDRTILYQVATVLTVYGIETRKHPVQFRFSTLQQYLPFTVLKHKSSNIVPRSSSSLQQYLPFTVLKLLKLSNLVTLIFSCNSTYRLRY